MSLRKLFFKEDKILFNEEEKVLVKFKRLSDNAVIPYHVHKGDVGMDITATDVVYEPEKDRFRYHTGLAMETVLQVGAFLFPRSSNVKTDVYLPNSVGIVDSAIYRGEICFYFKNRTSLETMIRNKQVEQMVSILTEKGKFTKKEISELNNVGEEIIENIMSYAPYEVGDRIGQMVILKIPKVEVEEVEELSETERGTGGFGSTGK